MKPEYPIPVTFVAVLALVAGIAVGAEQPAPGVKRVCVPAADGRTWECGTTDAPPPQRPVAPRDAPPPPAFLAPPGGPEIMPLEDAATAQTAPVEAPRTDDFPSAPDRDAATDDSTAPVTDDPVAEEPAAPGTSEVGETAANEAVSPEAAPADVADAASEPAATVDSTTSGATPPQSAGSDGSSSSDGATDASFATNEPPVFLQPPRRRGLAPGAPISPDAPAEPVTDASASASIPSEPAAIPAEAVAAMPTETHAPVTRGPETEVAVTDAVPEDATMDPPRDADAFRALAGTGYTVQLAHAERPDGFAQAVAALGLDARDTFALPVRRDGKRWWMLVWSSFPDAASAREATARLPGDASLNVGYPRRIALIQRELEP